MSLSSWSKVHAVSLFILLASGVGCGPEALFRSVDTASTNCTAGQAAILVGDGFFENLCGCVGATEVAGTIHQAPGGLTCHLATADSVVFFHFLGTVLRHQILSIGSNTFLSSPLSDPNDGVTVRAHMATFSQPTTTYDFKDAFSGLTGQIIVP